MFCGKSIEIHILQLQKKHTINGIITQRKTRLA